MKFDSVGSKRHDFDAKVDDFGSKRNDFDAKVDDFDQKTCLIWLNKMSIKSETKKLDQHF